MVRLFTRFFTPGLVEQGQAIAIAVLATGMIFVMDYMTGANARLGALYVVPIGFIGLHCNDRRVVLALTAVSAVMQATFYTLERAHLTTLTVDIVVDVVAKLFVASLAMSERRNYLEMEAMAQTDALTKLVNRRGFEMRLKSEIERQRRYGGGFSLLQFDLDHFKQLNDLKGHAAGDHALVMVGEVLAHCTRHSDTTARLGGDEFVVLLPLTNTGQCHKMAQHLLDKIRSRMQDARYGVTASMGATSFDEPPKSPAAALEVVDKAMYQAKARGRDQIVMV